jgi:hypothetical protein
MIDIQTNKRLSISSSNIVLLIQSETEKREVGHGSAASAEAERNRRDPRPGSTLGWRTHRRGHGKRRGGWSCRVGRRRAVPAVGTLPSGQHQQGRSGDCHEAQGRPVPFRTPSAFRVHDAADGRVRDGLGRLRLITTLKSD